MKIFKPITLLLTLCLALILSTSLAFAADATVTLNCASTAKAGDTVTISGTATSGSSISIKIVDASGNIVYFDAVKADSNGEYTNDFLVPESLAGTAVTVVAGYGDNVATKTLTINSKSLLTGPTLTADSSSNNVGQAIDITFTDNSAWRDAITGITVKGTSISGKYSLSAGKITINSSVFSAAGTYAIVVNATGYNDVSVTQTIKDTTTGGGGGGGGSTTTEDTPTTPTNTTTNTNTVTATTSVSSTTNSDGKASASVTTSQITAAISEATAEAASENGQPAIEIDVEADSNATSVEATIPQAAIGDVADGDIQSLTVSSPIAEITFDQASLEGIAEDAVGDVNITAGTVDVSTLSSDIQDQIGDHPVYSFSVTSGGNTISQFDGNVTIEVPYELADGEDPNDVVIYYINSSGNLEIVQDCYYDEASGKIVFTSTHLSEYAVGYNEVNFSDVSGWYADYVNYLASRDIITGSGDGKFLPSANITRAEFAKILANMSGDDLSAYTSSSFTDVKTTAWYAKAVAWAYANGVVTGADGKFNPNAYITRQDIALMLDRYTDKIAKTTLTQTANEVAFADQSSISDYAGDSVSTIQQAGIISGRSDNTFDPKANATRAETSKMIALLLQNIIG